MLSCACPVWAGARSLHGYLRSWASGARIVRTSLVNDRAVAHGPPWRVESGSAQSIGTRIVAMKNRLRSNNHKVVQTLLASLVFCIAVAILIHHLAMPGLPNEPVGKGWRAADQVEGPVGGGVAATAHGFQRGGVGGGTKSSSARPFSCSSACRRPRLSCTAARTVSTITWVLRSISMFRRSPTRLSANTV